MELFESHLSRPLSGDERIIDFVSSALTAIRKIKSEAKLSMKTKVQKLEIRANESDLRCIEMALDDLCDAGSVLDYTSKKDSKIDKLEVSAELEAAESKG